MSITDIRSNLTEFIQLSETAKALQYLQDLLPDGAEKRTQTIMLQGQLSHVNKKYQTGQLKFEDEKIEIAKINAAILDMAQSLSDADFQAKAPPSGQAPVSAAAPKFMVVYAPEDEAHNKLLNRHLNVLKIMKKIRVYNVLEPQGVDLLAQANTEIADADYLLVLITVNLFNSPEWFEFVYNALGEGRRMIPLRIERADFEGTGLEKFKALPSMGKAVSDYPNADTAYADIVSELKKLLPK